MKALMRGRTRPSARSVDEVQGGGLRRVDRQVVEDALRQTVKRSLQELSRSINGDAKTEVARSSASVVLSANKVEFKPSIAELTQRSTTSSKDAIATTSACRG